MGEELVCCCGCGSNGRVVSRRRRLCEEVGKERSTAEALGFVLCSWRTKADLNVTSVVCTQSKRHGRNCHGGRRGPHAELGYD